jgi:hypothetical protein
MKIRITKFILGLFGILLLTNTGFAQNYCKNESNSIKQVKTRSVGNTEYVIFDIVKNAEFSGAPNYTVETASRPFTGYVEDDGEIPVKGAKFKKVVFRSINWMCETRIRTKSFKGAVRDLKNLYAFEGISEFVVGYRAKSRYISTYSYDAGAVTKVVLKFRK